MTLERDWTVGEDGCFNTSARFLAACKAVEQAIRDSAWTLIGQGPGAISSTVVGALMELGFAPPGQTVSQDATVRLAESAIARLAELEAKLADATFNCPGCGRHDFGFFGPMIADIRKAEARADEAETAHRAIAAVRSHGCECTDDEACAFVRQREVAERSRDSWRDEAALYANGRDDANARAERAEAALAAAVAWIRDTATWVRSRQETIGWTDTDALLTRIPECARAPGGGA